MESLDGPQPVHVRLKMQLLHHLGSLVAFSPSVVWLVAFFLIPLCIVFAYSFAEPNVYGGVILRFTLHNYSMLLAPLYFKVFVRSIWIAFVTTGICLAVGYPVAYFISTRGARWKNTLIVLVILPFWTSTLVRTYAWITILRSEGVINTVLISLGLINDPLKLLYTPGAVILGLVHVYLPFMILPLYASIEKFDFSLIEAALDLGANRIKAFISVTLPNTMPGVVAGVMLVLVPSIGSFVIPDLLGGSKTWMVGNVIQHLFLQTRDWALGSAVSFVLLALCLAGIAVYFRASGQERMELM